MTGRTIQKEWTLDLDFSAPMGETYTRFVEGLKEKTFLGNRCGERTFFPPRPFCDRTLAPAGEWLESDGNGTVEAFTVIHEKSKGVAFPGTEHFPEVPYVLGVIRINGSDQCLIHFLAALVHHVCAAHEQRIERSMYRAMAELRRLQGESLPEGEWVDAEADDEAADEAIAELNGSELDGRTIRVDVAQAKERSGGGGGGGSRW